MLLMLIGMGSGSLSKELYDWFGYTSSTATASAFVQQRNKIRPEAVKMIFNEFVSSTTPTATFQGYRLFAVDGSDLRLPSDPTNDFSLIRNAEGQKQYNLAHLNAMFDLMSKVYVDATMQGKKGMNEHKALVSMIDRSNIPGKVIVLMDRGYESFNNIAHLQEKKWNYIIRAKESYGMISNLQLPNSEEFDVDTTLTLTRRQTKETLALLSAYPERYRWIQPHTTFDYIAPKDPTMYDLRFRIVRFRISGGCYETVYTNLDSETFPVEKIKELYRLRWGIETSFRELMYEAAVSLKTARQRNTCEKENDAIDLLRDFVRCDNCGQPMKRRVSMKHRIRESWNCTNDDCGIRVRISDTQLIETITVLINRIILNDHLLQPKPKKRYEPDAKVTKVGNDIALELERDAPNEDYIIEKAIEMAALMYEQSNAKLNLTVSLARKLAHTMVTQDEFNRDYFTALASYITLGEQGRVVLHTKTETEVTLDDGSNESP